MTNADSREPLSLGGVSRTPSIYYTWSPPLSGRPVRRVTIVAGC